MLKLIIAIIPIYWGGRIKRFAFDEKKL